MRCLLPCLLPLAFLGALSPASDLAAQTSPTAGPTASPNARRTLSAAAADALRERMGGEPLAVFAAWGRQPREQDVPAWLADGAPRDALYHQLLHAALWCDDHDAAYAAASLLPEAHLDIADIDRWLQVVWPHVFDEDPKWDWDTFKHVLSSKDVARLLHEPQSWFAEIRYFFLSDLHRSMRPEHIPALCQLTHHQDPFVRKQAWGNLGNLATYTDRHREAIARALLEWPGPGFDEIVDQYDRSRNLTHVPRAYTLPVARPGWSPLLRAMLERQFLEQTPVKGATPFATFSMRWAEDETPAAEDRLLLRALLDSPDAAGVNIALRALCRIGPDAHLRRVLEQMAKDRPEPLVLAALGEMQELRELAADDAEALAAGLEFDFEGVWMPWVAAAFGDDAEQGLEAIQLLADASRELRAPYRPRPGLSASLLRAYELFGSKLEHARLHLLVAEFPAARSEQLLAAYRATITPANLATSAVAVLEVCPYFDFASDLVQWAKSPDPAQAKPALDALLRMGHNQLGDELLAHWQAVDGKDLFVLARSGDALPVQEHLQTRLRELPWSDGQRLGIDECDLLCAVAMTHGLSEAAARSWSRSLATAEGATKTRLSTQFSKLRELVLDSEPIDALVASLATVPPTELRVTDLGTVDDDRVRELLRSVRNQPGCNVQAVIGELAQLDDFASERELDEMRVRNLYGWLDNATANVRTLGESLDLMPWLIGEIETICCRRNGAGWAIEQLTGFDVWAQPEYGLITQHDAVARWWQEVGGQLRWSKFAQRHVVGPR